MNKSDADAHPLDGCDPDDCYRVMMAERTALITARRESEDSLVKTIIQLAAALIALMAGFVSQTNVNIGGCALLLFAITMTALGCAIIAGLTEHYFASKAYGEQLGLVESYFQKEISTFAEPAANKIVRKAQLTAFASFVAALVLLGTFAFVEAQRNNADRQRKSAAPAAAAAAPAATAAAAPAATAAAAAPAATAAPTEQVRRRLQGRHDEVSGAPNAATPTEEIASNKS